MSGLEGGRYRNSARSSAGRRPLGAASPRRAYRQRGWPSCNGRAVRRSAVAVRAGSVHGFERDWWKRWSRRRRRVSRDQDRVRRRTSPGAAPKRPGAAAPRRAPSFFKRDVMAVEEAPEHGNREALTAILDQALLDLEQRDVRRAADQAEQIVALRLDTAGPAIAP